jgi:hypothetical protein
MAGSTERVVQRDAVAARTGGPLTIVSSTRCIRSARAAAERSLWLAVQLVELGDVDEVAKPARCELHRAEIGERAHLGLRIGARLATIVADCAKADLSAFGTLFEGDSAKDQAPAVRAITADHKAAPGRT